MHYQATGLWTIAALAVLSGPGIALGQNLNLTGNLNINDTQLASTSNLLLTMLVSLAESIIPIVVGAAVGHKSITYWQEKKDRIATKNNIIAYYGQSFKSHIQILDNFAHKVFKSYITFADDRGSQAVPINEYSNTEDKVNGYLKFPSDQSELPSKRFEQEYDSMLDKMTEISQVRERLYLDLKYFSKDGIDIIEKLQNVKNMLKRSEILLDKLIKSTEVQDFISCYNVYSSLSNKIKIESEKIELDLVHFSSGRPSR